MLNQASWKNTNVSLPVFFGLRHVACMMFLIPVNICMDKQPLFHQLSHFGATFRKVKGYSHSVISLGLVCGVTGCDLGTVLAGEVYKKKKKKTKQPFIFFFNPSGVPRQEWCNFQSCGQLQLSLMYFVDSSMDASSLAFGNRIWKCHPKVPLSAKWP